MAMHTRRLLPTSLLLCIALSALTACAGQPIVRTETVTVRVPVIEPVPPELTAPVAKPAMHGDTNGAAWDYILALQHALDEANAKLEQIAGLSPDGTQTGTIHKQGRSSAAH